MEEEDSHKLYPEETSEVRFALHTYGDIFSDFDPRPLAQRGPSEDFLAEAKRAVIVKEAEKIDFIFMISKKDRNLNEEGKIENRLREYFRKHFGLLQKEKKKMFKKWISMSILGMIFMFIATFLIFNYKDSGLGTSFLIILFEPAGWFLFWEGLNHLLDESKEISPDLKFHEKMSKARIRFSSV
jgi:hypothetical protein